MVRPINNQSADESLIMSFSHDDEDDLVMRRRVMVIHVQSPAVESEIISAGESSSMLILITTKLIDITMS